MKLEHPSSSGRTSSDPILNFLKTMVPSSSGVANPQIGYDCEFLYNLVREAQDEHGKALTERAPCGFYHYFHIENELAVTRIQEYDAKHSISS